MTNDNALIQEIKKYEVRLLEAFIKRDVETLEQLIDDELIFIGPDGKSITKEMDLHSYKTGDMLINSLNTEDQAINISGDIAIVAVTVELDATLLSLPIKGKYRYLRIWKKTGNSWKIIAGSYVPKT